jgi:hypothetical protein
VRSPAGPAAGPVSETFKTASRRRRYTSLMSNPRFDDARRFLYAEGRLLERRLFGVLFEEAGACSVVDALLGYRNPDGGFGHGLEPDKRVPDSQPLDVEAAFWAMDTAGHFDHDLARAACDFLQRIGPGVGPLTETYRDYPRAPHWGDFALAPDLNPTAGIAAMLWKWDIDHPWREAATAFCWERIEAGLPEDAHGFGETLSFFAWAPQRSRADEAAAKAGARLGSLRMFRLDPAEPGYGVTPLHYAPAPDSRWAGLFEPSVIEAHLDALAAAQLEDGGWPISWEPIGPAAGYDCRGAETLRALRTLRALGRL